jgi:Raf kinase inhibitor-like YbhB/YbcL family protein
MKITSVFGQNQPIPVKYTCDGEDISPSITFDDVPHGTQSLVLIFMAIEPAVTSPAILWHIFNIPPNTKWMAEGTIPDGAIEGLCSDNTYGYSGPCPKYFKNAQQYIFKVFALDGLLDLPNRSTFQTVEKAMNGHIMDTTELAGTVNA